MVGVAVFCWASRVDTGEPLLGPCRSSGIDRIEGGHNFSKTSDHITVQDLGFRNGTSWIRLCVNQLPRKSSVYGLLWFHEGQSIKAAAKQNQTKSLAFRSACWHSLQLFFAGTLGDLGSGSRRMPTIRSKKLEMLDDPLPPFRI